jgi:dephospho-CoA kinase
MAAIGITGGVASGKSTLTALLAGLLRSPSFDADACARDLLRHDGAVAREVRAAFGPEVFTLVGGIDRTALRHRVFSDREERRRLEAIIHPRVRAGWQEWMREQLQNGPGKVLLVEIPLLYETAAGQFFDRTIVVGCGRETQMRRLTGERRLAAEIAGQIVASQWDLSAKIRLCDHLIWNEGSLDNLRSQAELYARYLEPTY